tara:strand:- start:73 stop:399 length:327 start_codon:yes stop_codon:yes gene_type:complete
VVSSIFIYLFSILTCFTIRIKKKDINKKIIDLNSNSIPRLLTKTEFPITYYEEFTKLKVDYDEIVNEEKNEVNKLMSVYYSKMYEKSPNHTRAETDCNEKISFIIKNK